ncbi:hypothetical protein [Vibrio sp. D431a]|uniref:hypothetical protein n=1 Tax=Vibrio sp. D431a TaxID=2837388 RepID=UPI00255339A0|nr:hypothetical protein [Vibrio sp. D431a]MDK9793799.1 hypothetical protein [Vibrio sp. D431a]
MLNLFKKLNVFVADSIASALGLKSLSRVDDGYSICHTEEFFKHVRSCAFVGSYWDLPRSYAFECLSSNLWARKRPHYVLGLGEQSDSRISDYLHSESDAIDDIELLLSDPVDDGNQVISIEGDADFYDTYIRAFVRYLSGVSHLDLSNGFILVINHSSLLKSDTFIEINDLIKRTPLCSVYLCGDYKLLDKVYYLPSLKSVLITKLDNASYIRELNGFGDCEYVSSDVTSLSRDEYILLSRESGKTKGRASL